MKFGRDALHHLKLFCAFAALIVGIFGVMFVVQEMRTAGWPSVTGVVVAIEIDRQPMIDDMGRTDRYHYTPEVTYTYVVQGMKYESKRVTVVNYSSGDDRHARRKIAKYPVGSEVAVYFDPNDPSSAVLETGFSIATCVVWGFAALMAAGTLGLQFYLRSTQGRLSSRRERRRGHRAH